MEEILNKPRTICPAKMLAISRNDNVIGRIKTLINSINTKNGVNTIGLPDGSNFLQNKLMFIVILLNSGPKKKGRAIINTNIGFTVTLNIVGIKPNQLKIKIDTNTCGIFLWNLNIQVIVPSNIINIQDLLIGLSKAENKSAINIKADAISRPKLQILI